MTMYHISTVIRIAIFQKKLKYFVQSIINICGGYVFVILANFICILFYHTHFSTSVNHYKSINILETLLTPLNSVVLWK